jgi:hypothetical protein
VSPEVNGNRTSKLASTSSKLNLYATPTTFEEITKQDALTGRQYSSLAFMEEPGWNADYPD